MPDLDLSGFPEPPPTEERITAAQERYARWLRASDGESPHFARAILDNFAADNLADVMAALTGAREDNAILRAEVERLQSLLEGAVEEWAVVYGDESHYRVSGATQCLQLAHIARGRGNGEAYAAHRLRLEWRRMELDRG